jgi:hypothetical protein
MAKRTRRKKAFAVQVTIGSFDTFDEAKAAALATTKPMREHIDSRYGISYEIVNDADDWRDKENGEVLADGTVSSHRQKRFVVSMTNWNADADEVIEYKSAFDTIDEANAAVRVQEKLMRENGIILTGDLDCLITDLEEKYEEDRKMDEELSHAYDDLKDPSGPTIRTIRSKL